MTRWVPGLECVTKVVEEVDTELSQFIKSNEVAEQVPYDSHLAAEEYTGQGPHIEQSFGPNEAAQLKIKAAHSGTMKTTEFIAGTNRQHVPKDNAREFYRPLALRESAKILITKKPEVN